MYRFYDFRIWAVQVGGRRGGEKERFSDNQPSVPTSHFFLLRSSSSPSSSLLFNSLFFSLPFSTSLPLPFPLVPVPRESLYRDRGEYRKFSGILTLPINALTGACTRLEDFRFPFAINAIAKNARQRDPHDSPRCIHHQDLERGRVNRLTS